MPKVIVLKSGKLSHKVVFRYLKNLLLVCLAAEFPLLVFWAANLGQIRPVVAIKPLLWIFVAAWGLYTLIALILRNIDKSALLVLLILMLFFTYGQMINLLEPVFPAAGSILTVSALIVYFVLFIGGDVPDISDEASTPVPFDRSSDRFWHPGGI